MREVRWGIIGCGDVTEVKSGPAFQKARGSSLVAVMRRTGELARDYARRHEVPRWYDNAADLIADPEVDAVYVATPPSSHAEYVIQAAAAGKPVYVEKPMARNAAECEAMIAACREAGVPLFVAYYRRALPRFLEVRRLVEEGAIGEVRAVQVGLCRTPLPSWPGTDWRIDPAIAGGGRFVDLACHTLDLLDYILGPIDEARAFVANQGGASAAEDLVSAAFRFASGIQAVGQWCFTAGIDLDVTDIVGTAGTISFATFDEAPILVSRPGGSESYQVPHPPHVQQPLIQTIVDTLLGSGTCPSTGETAIRTTRVMDAVLRDYYGDSGATRMPGE